MIYYAILWYFEVLGEIGGEKWRRGYKEEEGNSSSYKNLEIRSFVPHF